MAVVMETDRLFLRKMNENDVDHLHGIFSDPDCMTYFPGTRTRKETEEWLGRNFNNYEQHGYGLYAVELKETGQFIGHCGFIFQKDVDGRDEIEIGYGLLKAYQHQGYASEAARACKQYGFAHLETDRLISLIRPDNTPSRRVAESNGMTVEKSVDRNAVEALVYVIEREDYLEKA